MKGVGLGAVLVVAIGTSAAVVIGRPDPSPQPPAVAPQGSRIRVQVLNATATRGLGRRATAYLRDRGFDVVDIGTAPESRDSTVVLDRSGRGDWAALVARAFGGAPVEAHLDSSRYLDVTVLVGRNWTPPAEPFYP